MVNADTSTDGHRTSQLTQERRDALLEEVFRLAGDAAASGNPPFGSLIADQQGRVLATAGNSTVSDNDITAHPELVLARWVAAHHAPAQAAGLVMVTSCEPCPMCRHAIARARIGTVVFGLSTAQLDALRPLGQLSPEDARVGYDGPHLPDRSESVVRAFYRDGHTGLGDATQDRRVQDRSNRCR